MKRDMEENARVAIGAMEALVELLEGQDRDVEVSTRMLAPLMRVVYEATVKVVPVTRPIGVNDQQ